MYYMYIFALKLSEGNSINMLYICKFQKDYHIIKFADKSICWMGGDHYRKWSNKERNWRGVGWCSHVWRRVPLLFSIGLFRKEIRAPLLGPLLHLWHLMNVPHLFNITCNLVGRRMDRGCGVSCGHLDLLVAASSSAESRKPAWCCPSARLCWMLSHVFTSLAAKSTFLPATSVRKSRVLRYKCPAKSLSDCMNPFAWWILGWFLSFRASQAVPYPGCWSSTAELLKPNPCLHQVWCKTDTS